MKAIFLMTLFCATQVFADQTSEDISAILKDSAFINLVQSNEIQSIQNLGQRQYQILFGQCSVAISVVSNCLPTPGGACSLEVRINSSQINCMPSMGGSSK